MSDCWVGSNDVWTKTLHPAIRLLPAFKFADKITIILEILKYTQDKFGSLPSLMDYWK